MVGHLLGASGGVETIATALTIKTGMIHPTINLDTPDPDCDLDYVPKTAPRVECAAPSPTASASADTTRASSSALSNHRITFKPEGSTTRPRA